MEIWKMASPLKKLITALTFCTKIKTNTIVFFFLFNFFIFRFSKLIELRHYDDTPPSITRRMNVNISSVSNQQTLAWFNDSLSFSIIEATKIVRYKIFFDMIHFYTQTPIYTVLPTLHISMYKSQNMQSICQYWIEFGVVNTYLKQFPFDM